MGTVGTKPAAPRIIRGPGGAKPQAGYNFKALSCTPAYLNPPISQFLHIKTLMKSDVVRLKFVSYLC